MNEIELLREDVLKKFPLSSTKIDPPVTLTGKWFLDVRFGGKWAVIEWKPGSEKFGFSDCSTESEEDTPFDGPDQVCDDRACALELITKVLNG